MTKPHRRADRPQGSAAVTAFTSPVGAVERRPASPDGRSGIAATAAQASQALRTAEKLDRRRAFDGVDAQLKTHEAAALRAEGERLLVRPASLVGNARHELVPAPVAPETLSCARQHVLCTLEEPSVVSERLLANEADRG